MAKNYLSLLVTCGVAAIAAPALAQTVAPEDNVATAAQPQDDGADIVVTAQKREERIIDVPVSVSVVNPAQLDRQNIQSVGELARAVPSLNGSDPKQLAIRGVQTGGVNRTSESAATVVLDGVVLGRAAISGLFDVARVEVLSGPQGMLFGKNASAGVVNIVTASPSLTKRELTFHADAGSFNLHRERITANVPLGDTTAVRFSAYNDFSDTPVRTAPRDYDRNYQFLNGVRGRFLWEATPNLTFNLIGDYERSNSSGTANIVFGRVEPGSVLESTLAACGVTAGRRNLRNCSDASWGGSVRSERYGVSGQFDLSIGDYTLTSITANRWYNLGDFDHRGDTADSDILPTDILNTNHSATDFKTFSQELRLASPTGRTVEFVAGLFYSDTKSRDRVTQAGRLGTIDTAIFGLPFGVVPTWLAANGFNPTGPYGPTTRFGRQTTIDADQRSMAAFGQATINVTDKLSLIAGARYTDEKLDVLIVSPGAAGLAELGYGYFGAFSAAFPNLDETVKTDNFSWKLGARYEFSNTLSAYATASRGYKGPAVNDQAVVGSGISPVIDPEIPMYYELGLKGSFAGGRLLGTIALFHNKVKDFQTTVFVPVSDDVPVAVYAQGNAPYIKSKGVELSLVGKPTRDLSLNLGVIYNDTSYSPDFVVATPTGPGRPVKHLAGAPLWRVVLGGEYSRNLTDRLTGFVQTDFVYESPTSFTPAPDPIMRRNSSHQLGGRIGIRDENSGWGISIWGRNLLKDYDPTFQGDPLATFNGSGGGSYYMTPSTQNFRTFGSTIDMKF